MISHHRFFLTHLPSWLVLDLRSSQRMLERYTRRYCTYITMSCLTLSGCVLWMTSQSVHTQILWWSDCDTGMWKLIHASYVDNIHGDIQGLVTGRFTDTCTRRRQASCPASMSLNINVVMAMQISCVNRWYHYDWGIGWVLITIHVLGSMNSLRHSLNH